MVFTGFQFLLLRCFVNLAARAFVLKQPNVIRLCHHSTLRAPARRHLWQSNCRFAFRVSKQNTEDRDDVPCGIGSSNQNVRFSGKTLAAATLIVKWQALPDGRISAKLPSLSHDHKVVRALCSP